jgi:hypothetical protein
VCSKHSPLDARRLFTRNLLSPSLTHIAEAQLQQFLGVLYYLAMIKPEERFFSDGGAYFGPAENPKTEAFLNLWDWDQLRMVKLKGTAKIFPPDEGHEIQIFAQFADYLSPEVRRS